MTAARAADVRLYYEFNLKITKTLHDGGVGVLLGTDSASEPAASGNNRVVVGGIESVTWW